MEMGKLKEDLNKAKSRNALLEEEARTLREQDMAKPKNDRKVIMVCRQTHMEKVIDEPINKKKKPKQAEDKLNQLRREQKKYIAELSTAFDSCKAKDRRIRMMVLI